LAVKLTATFWPLAMVQELIRIKVTAVVVGALGLLNPDWRQPDAESTIEPLVGALPSAGADVTVMEPPLDSAAVAVKVTVKFTLVLCTVLVGVAVTAFTPPVGAPIVKGLDWTLAARAGKAVTPVKVPKEARASARALAKSLTRLPPGFGNVSDGRCICI
jgi:hypothetical protein